MQRDDPSGNRPGGPAPAGSGGDGGAAPGADGDAVLAALAHRLRARSERQQLLTERLRSGELRPGALADLAELAAAARRGARDGDHILVMSGARPAPRGGAAVPLGQALSTAVAASEAASRTVVPPTPSVSLDATAEPVFGQILAELLAHAVASTGPGERLELHIRWAPDGGVVLELLCTQPAQNRAPVEELDRMLASGRPDGPVAPHEIGLYVAARLSRAIGARLGTRHAAGTQAVPGLSPVAVLQLPPSVLAGGRGGADSVRTEDVVAPEPADVPDVPAAPATTSVPVASEPPVPPWPPIPAGDADTGNPAPAAAQGAAPGTRNAPGRPMPLGAWQRHSPLQAGPPRVGPAQGSPVQGSPAQGSPARVGPTPAEPTRAQGPQPGHRPEPAAENPGTAARVPQGPPPAQGSPPAPGSPPAQGPPPGQGPASGPQRAGQPASAPRPQPAAGTTPPEVPAVADTPSVTEAMPVPGTTPPVELFGPFDSEVPVATDDMDGTPIFAAVASAWFRDPEAASAPPTTALPTAGPNGAPNGNAPQNWSTVGDAEFEAARARANRVVESPTTARGLPQRRPGEQMVPPSRRDAPGGASRHASPVERQPDRVRNRLASYQRGLREGRHRAAEENQNGNGRGNGPAGNGANPWSNAQRMAPVPDGGRPGPGFTDQNGARPYGHNGRNVG